MVFVEDEETAMFWFDVRGGGGGAGINLGFQITSHSKGTTSLYLPFNE